MAGERSHHEEWETENQLSAHEAQDALGEPVADWSDQPTQPQRQRRIDMHRDWPSQPSGPRPEWPLRAATARTATSPLHRLLDAAHERQFNLGCGAVAALVLIVAAFVAAFTNGWLPSNAGPIGPQPGIQANPAQSSLPIPTITPRPSPTATPVPTDTPIPTETPAPTTTPVPTESPIPTQTPIPSPTATPLPTDTPAPTQEPAGTPTLP